MAKTKARSVGVMAFLLAVGAARAASAEEPPKLPAPEPPSRFTNLTGFAGAGYMTSGGGHGAALSSGVRLGIGRYFALGFDFGYGLMATPQGSAFRGTTMEDRWWLMPSMAFVIPARVGSHRLAFDLGVGLGVGTTSGYSSGARYADQPLSADWEYQLIPTFRLHAIAAMEVGKNLEVFARADAASLIMEHGTGLAVTDHTWLLLSLGTRFNLY